jgi:hypothetical protein
MLGLPSSAARIARALSTVFAGSGIATARGSAAAGNQIAEFIVPLLDRALIRLGQLVGILPGSIILLDHRSQLPVDLIHFHHPLPITASRADQHPHDRHHD